MSMQYDQMMILRIAKAYYLEGLGQQEISERENIHRSQISRILKRARELGYVKISVSTPESVEADRMARLLKDALHLKQVCVAPLLSSRDTQDEAFYFFASRQLEMMLQGSQHIGIGLGKTLYHIASQLTTQPISEKKRFYSIVGSSGTNNPYLQASVILDHFARRFNGTCYYNNFPICMNRAMMTTFDQKRYEELQATYAHLDTVVLSVGGPLSMGYPYIEEFAFFNKDVRINRLLSRPHANILGHLIYEDKDVIELPDDYFITSMPLVVLPKVETVICIANGEQKVQSLIHAAEHGYFNTLITDEPTARKMLRAMDVS